MSDLIDPNAVRDITGAWDYKTLGGNTTIGSDCYLERRDSFKRYRSILESGLVLGDRVTVYTWAEFSVEPTGRIEIGDDSVVVGAIFMCAQSIIVGRRVIISYNVTIADSDFHPLDPEERIRDAIANAPDGDRSRRPPITSSEVIVEDDAWIGIGAIILKGVRIGRAARIGAGAVVTRDVAAGAVVEGNPAREILASPRP